MLQCEDRRPCARCVDDGVECIDLARKGGPGSRIKKACNNCKLVLPGPLLFMTSPLTFHLKQLAGSPNPNATTIGLAGTVCDVNFNAASISLRRLAAFLMESCVCSDVQPPTDVSTGDNEDRPASRWHGQIQVTFPTRRALAPGFNMNILRRCPPSTLYRSSIRLRT